MCRPLRGSAALFFLFAATAAAQGIITTVAGTDYIFPDDGQPAAQARLVSPNSLFFDPSSGDLYFTDLGLSMVLRIDSKGIVHVVAGSGLRVSIGNGGPARAAAFAGPVAVLVSQRVLYVGDGGQSQIRKIDVNGIITTIAGTNTGSSGDGGPAIKAQLDLGRLALDNAGNLYVADPAHSRVRKIDVNGIITTFAGNGTSATTGDGGAATNASLFFPNDLVLDSAGNMYIAQGNGYIRKVTPNGIISALVQNGNALSGIVVDAAGNLVVCEQNGSRILGVNPNNGNVTVIAGTGVVGFADGAASKAMFSGPTSVAVDPSGNIYVADNNNGRIRKISGGNVTTIAGVGAFTGDGGPATAALINYPKGFSVDSAGNIYIADTQSHRIRKVTTDGIITTILGNGNLGSSRDGVAAAAAVIAYPQTVLISPQGEVVYPDGNSVRKIASDGTLVTIAGTGASGSTGDGGPATSATLNTSQPVLNYDSAGNLYYAEPTRVRKISPSGIITAFAGTGQSGNSGDGGPATSATFINILAVAADPAGNVYIADLGANLVRRVDTKGIVTTVAGNGKGGFSAGPGPGTSIPLNSPVALAADRSGNVFIAEGSLVRKLDPSGNLSIYAGTQRFGTSGDGGSALAASFDSLKWLYCDPAGNLYIDDIRASRIRVVQAGPSPSILLSQKGLTFAAVPAGGAPAPQSFNVVNGGQGTLTWGVTATTASGGNWLSVSPASGSSPAGSAGPPVQVTVNASALAPGDYYGQVLVRANAAPNSPQSVTIVLNVRTAGTFIGTSVQPSGLLFTTAGAQSLTLTTLSSTAVTYGATASSPQNWFTATPLTGTVTPGKPVTVQVLPNLAGLAPGVYNGTITFAFSDNSVQTVQLLLVVTSGGTTQPAAPGVRPAACAPSKLLPLFTSLGAGFNVTTGWPSPVELRVVDDCGTPLTAGSVTATFSNADPALSLNSLGDGRWTATWQAQNAAASVSVTANAQAPDKSLNGSAQITGGLNKNANPPPVVAAGGVLNAASYQLQASLAPGSLISIFGQLLAQGAVSAPALPLTNSLSGTVVSIAGRPLPLLYAGPDQVNAMIPYDLPINATHQLIVQRGTAISIPQPVNVLSSLAGAFTKDLTGQGLGIVVKVANDGTQTVVGPDNPATAYDALVIYCTGLGDVSPRQIAGQQAPFNPISQTLDTVKVTVGGIDAPVFFAGVTPGFTGLYQVNAYVPTGVTPGPSVPLVISEGGRLGPPVTIPVR